MLRLVRFAFLLVLIFSTCKVQSIPHQKIVGGEEIDISEQLHQVALEQDGYQICGGSIIQESFVVSAAHCIDRSSSQQYQIRAGSSELEYGGEVRNVSRVFLHPQYNALFDNDISVLYLEQPLSFSKAIQPIELAIVRPESGTEAVTSGWGVINEDYAFGPDMLQAVTVPITSQVECRKAYGENSITDRMICAGYPEGGKNHCYGDSGGPLVADGKLVGIVSFSRGCGRPGFPGVYASIVELRQFILDSIDDVLG